jgi:tRNA threonylcarbamoyladenosine modification (KEOPS) complex  Pcc1 subunit
MKLSCTLTTNEPFTHLQKLFATELDRKHERSSITLTEEHGKAVFSINATDTTALRAAINTVTSVLGMYEKTTQATNDH